MTPPPSDRIDGTLLRLIGVLGLGGVMSYLDATMVNLSIHTLKARFSVPLGTISWVATGYLLAVAAGEGLITLPMTPSPSRSSARTGRPTGARGQA
ncbi:MAG TPA: hypothetical protein VI365_13425 [Trebonia sp.]